MMFFNYFLLRGWSLEQILALGVFGAVVLGVVAFRSLLRRADHDRAGILGFAPVAPPPLPPLPTRPPHEHDWIPARTPDGDERDMCIGCGVRRLPVPSKMAATLFVAQTPSDVDSADWTEIAPGVWSCHLEGVGQ